jgi:hypothetical protein
MSDMPESFRPTERGRICIAFFAYLSWLIPFVTKWAGLMRITHKSIFGIFSLHEQTRLIFICNKYLWVAAKRIWSCFAGVGGSILEDINKRTQAAPPLLGRPCVGQSCSLSGRRGPRYLRHLWQPDFDRIVDRDWTFSKCSKRELVALSMHHFFLLRPIVSANIGAISPQENRRGGNKR